MGSTEQWFSLKGNRDESYGRHVKAIDGFEPRLVVDEVFGRLIHVPPTVVVEAQKLS